LEIFPEILGRSQAMQRLFEAMSRVAGHDVIVHIHGETGTGKEKVARALHSHSPRRSGPFEAVNAAGLSDELFESSFFGHARGAFTGAVADRPGHVTAAEGGTLFLDEVAELSLAGQAKLLRFLQELEYQRVGETRLRRANVRVVTAANVDLAQRVVERRFREDLLFRLDVMRLEVPPLRERGDDVRFLAGRFLERAAKTAGVARPDGTMDFWRALQDYHWPGNVRQLENEMQGLVLFGGAGALTREHLSARVAEGRPAQRIPLRCAVEGFERALVTRMLQSHSGARTATAVALGITRQALHAKMRRLGIP
jgi:two-component system response regulator HydG